MKIFTATILSAALLASGAAYADRYQSLGEVTTYASIAPEGNGHVDLAQAKPEGNGHVDIASIPAEGYTAPEGTATAAAEGNGHIDVADAYPQNEGHVQMGG